MSERGKRVFRFLLDPERDADVIGRIEAQPSMTGYLRDLVRRDMHEREMHDERLDFAALKASELQAENHKLRELVRGLWYCTENMSTCEGCPLGEVEGDKLALACEKMMYELGIEVE